MAPGAIQTGGCSVMSEYEAHRPTLVFRFHWARVRSRSAGAWEFGFQLRLGFAADRGGPAAQGSVGAGGDGGQGVAGRAAGESRGRGGVVGTRSDGERWA